MTKLTGTFECKIDNKGRILLPSQLKKQLDGNLKDVRIQGLHGLPTRRPPAAVAWPPQNSQQELVGGKFPKEFDSQFTKGSEPVGAVSQISPVGQRAELEASQSRWSSQQ